MLLAQSLESLLQNVRRGRSAHFTELSLQLVDGSTLELPDGIDAKYKVILFYRGHW